VPSKKKHPNAALSSGVFEPGPRGEYYAALITPMDQGVPGRDGFLSVFRLPPNNRIS
jgi:hypothetical protein